MSNGKPLEGREQQERAGTKKRAAASPALSRSPLMSVCYFPIFFFRVQSERVCVCVCVCVCV